MQISGNGFFEVSAVRFGEAGATEFSIDSSTSITAVAPPGSGTVDVRVTTPAGTSVSSAADRFRYSPDVVLTSKPNPALPSAKITFTARIDPLAVGVPMPTGVVTFADGSAALGTVAVGAEGVATFKTSSLSTGTHEIIATYSGDSYFGPREAVVSQVVSRASASVTLTSSKNPAPAGSAGSLTATVEGSLAPPKPTGTVTFSEGAAVLATVPLSGKSAKYPLKSLSAGVHEIVASYSGDTDFAPSSSNVLMQTIAP